MPESAAKQDSPLSGTQSLSPPPLPLRAADVSESIDHIPALAEPAESDDDESDDEDYTEAGSTNHP